MSYGFGMEIYVHHVTSCVGPTGLEGKQKCAHHSRRFSKLGDKVFLCLGVHAVLNGFGGR